MSKALDLATLATGNFATTTDVTNAIDGIVIPEGGKVLQTVHFTKPDTVAMQHNADGVVHSGIAITPTSDTSKILIIASGCIIQGGDTGAYATLDLRKGATVLTVAYNAMGYQMASTARTGFSVNYLDSPATTTEVTYSLYHYNDNGTGEYQYVETNYTLLEIAA